MVTAEASPSHEHARTGRKHPKKFGRFIEFIPNAKSNPK
jgi:hypothetical protein